jgi:small subunit ribosomal protein S16
MLTIRLQRGGRKGHPHYRVIVQDSRFSPTSGRYAAMIGTYDPHTKATNIDTAKAELYLSNGAQPSPRVAYLLKSNGVTLPSWVKDPSAKSKAIRHVGKLKRNTEPAPVEETPAVEVSEAAPTEEVVAEVAVAEEA